MFKKFIFLALLAWHTMGAAIEIPADPEIMGIREDQISTIPCADLWQRLYSSFTDQTLANFAKGDNRGVFIVHALEESPGGDILIPATDCFTQWWNTTHPNDQRHPSSRTNENFAAVFGNDFVSHYAEYVLAKRYLIAGSVVAFNQDATFTLSKTFGPVCFILKVPSECVVCAETSDLGSPVCYAMPKENAQDFNRKKEEIIQFVKNERFLQSVDAMLHFPQISGEVDNYALLHFPEVSQEELDKYILEYNEVGFLSCKVGMSDEVYRPKIVGVFINYTCAIDTFYIESAQQYARDNNLPIIYNETHNFLKIPADTSKFPQYLTKYMQDKSLKRRPEFIKYLELVEGCANEHEAKEKLKEHPEFQPIFDQLKSEKEMKHSFQLSAEQIAGYGLRDEPSPAEQFVRDGVIVDEL